MWLTVDFLNELTVFLISLTPFLVSLTFPESVDTCSGEALNHEKHCGGLPSGWRRKASKERLPPCHLQN